MPMEDTWYLSIGTDMEHARALVLAAGVNRGKKFPGETEFLGRGVSYCATCDGMLYRGKPVAVLGYTPTARHEAEFLEGIGCSVTYFERPASCTIRGGSQVEEITCDGKTAAVAGVFILRPTMAPTELFPGLAVENGYVTVDRRMATIFPASLPPETAPADRSRCPRPPAKGWWRARVPQRMPLPSCGKSRRQNHKFIIHE